MIKFLKEIWHIVKKFNLLFIVMAIMLYFSMYKDAIYYVSLFCFLAIIYIPIKKYLDITGAWLFLFSILYVFMVYMTNMSSGNWRLITNILAPIVFYCFGKYIVDKTKSENELLTFILLIIILFSFRSYLGTIHDIATNGIVSWNRRLMSDAELGGNTATSISVNVSLGLAGLSIFCGFYQPWKSFKGWIFLAVYIFSLYAIIHILSRSGIIVAISSLAVIIFYVNNKKKWNIFIVISIVIGAIFLLAKTSEFSADVLSAYRERNIETGATMGGRFERWSIAYNNIFDYPFGWASKGDFAQYYAHNLWLDVNRIGGIIPFFCLIVANSKALICMLKVIKGERTTIKVSILALNVSFFLQSLVEPIIEGLPLFFYLYCMLWGLQKKYLDNLNNP